MVEYVYQPRSNTDWDRRVNQSGGNFTHFIRDEYRLFTPQRGENKIRILPPSSQWKNPPHAGLDVYVHYGVGPGRGGSVICPKHGAPQIGRGGEPCPICYDHNKALKANDEKLAYELRAVKRVVTFILDQKDLSKGVLCWPMPFTLDRDIGKVSRNRSAGGYFAIDHPLEGYDVFFDKDGEMLQTKYTGVQLATEPTPVADRYIEFIEANPIPEVLIWRDYEEVKRIYEGRAAGEEEEEAPERSTRPPRDGNGRSSERPRQEDDRPRVSTRHNSKEQPTAEDIDEDPWEDDRAGRRQAYRRPTGAAQASDNGSPAPAPAEDNGKVPPGNVHAADVRARFMKRRT